MKKRYFPCQYCKGRGDFGDGTFVNVGIGDVQVSAHTECGWCKGEGMIEIGGKIHRENQALKRGMKRMTEDRAYSHEEIIKLGGLI